MGTIFQRGQHAIIFGERGVGKTSLSNIIFDFLVMTGKNYFQVARYNCGVSVDFESIWRSALSQLTTSNGEETRTLDSYLPEAPTSEDIREVFQRSRALSTIVIIDEIDRISNPDTSTLLADTIK